RENCRDHRLDLGLFRLGNIRKSEKTFGRMKNTIVTIICLMVMTYGMAQTSNSMQEFDSHFAHTVYFWLKNPDSEADRRAFTSSLQRFLNQSQYARTNFIGVPPRATREVVDGSFTFSLIVTFESAEAQQKYQDEPAHKVFVEESSGLWEKVIVYDSQGVN
ncbi:MAG: Dabb family protein, partial [Bacteroidota bacterium]